MHYHSYVGYDHSANNLCIAVLHYCLFAQWLRFLAFVYFNYWGQYPRYWQKDCYLLSISKKQKVKTISRIMWNKFFFRNHWWNLSFCEYFSVDSLFYIFSAYWGMIMCLQNRDINCGIEDTHKILSQYLLDSNASITIPTACSSMDLAHNDIHEFRLWYSLWLNIIFFFVQKIQLLVELSVRMTIFLFLRFKQSVDFIPSLSLLIVIGRFYFSKFERSG